jgi:hypothetical protein
VHLEALGTLLADGRAPADEMLAGLAAGQRPSPAELVLRTRIR